MDHALLDGFTAMRSGKWNNNKDDIKLRSGKAGMDLWEVSGRNWEGNMFQIHCMLVWNFLQNINDILKNILENFPKTLKIT